MMDEYYSYAEAGQNYLSHHGILGQKWGVRRYQNYDGTLTQAGLKRYKKQKEKADIAVKNYRDAKKAYKDAVRAKKQNPDYAFDKEASKSRLSELKAIARKETRKQNSAYKALSKDKAADKGKALRKSGKTIADINKTENLVTGLLSVGLTAAYYGRMTGKFKLNLRDKRVRAAAAVGAAALSGYYIKNAMDRRHLRAYYAHSGWRDND